MEALGQCVRHLHDHFRSLEESGRRPERNTDALPVPGSTAHLQHTSRPARVLRRRKNRPWWLFRSKAKRRSRMLEIPASRTECRRVQWYIPDELPRTCEILRLWDIRGGNDQRPDCRKVCLLDPATEDAATGESRPVQNDKSCTKWGKCDTWLASDSMRNKRKPYTRISIDLVHSNQRKPAKTTYAWYM